MRPLPDLLRTKMCPVVLKGFQCIAGPSCIYAHSEGELRRTDAQATSQCFDSSQRQDPEVMNFHYAILFPCDFIDHPDGSIVEEAMKAKLREINQRTQSWDSFDESCTMDAFKTRDSDSTCADRVSDTQQADPLDESVGLELTVRNTFLHIGPVQETYSRSQSMSPGSRRHSKRTTPTMADHLLNAWTKHELLSHKLPHSPKVPHFEALVGA